MISDQEMIARRVFGMFDEYGITDKIQQIGVGKRIIQKIMEADE